MKYILFFLLVILISYTNNLRARDMNNVAFVTAVCNYAHTHNDGASEKQCGDAQDKTHTEYLCATRSTDLNCWVEIK